MSSIRLGGERAFTLVELLIVMAILGLVLTGIVNVLVSGSRVQADTSARATAQQNTRLALDRLEFEARCAKNASLLNSGAGVYLALPAQCSHATGDVSWCVSGGVLKRYGATTCTGTAQSFVDSVTSPTPFSMPSNANNVLPQLAVNLTVNGGNTTDAFKASDTITLRNYVKSIGAPSPASGAPGTSVTITGTGFLGSTPLTVKVGASLAVATITSGGTTAADGSFTTVFTIPFLPNGADQIVVTDGTNTLTSSTNFTVSSSYDGLGWTSVTHSGSQSLSCGSVALTRACTITGLGNTGNFTAKVSLVTSAGATVTNTSGSALNVSCGVATVTNPGASLAPTTSTIAANATASGSSFVMTGLGAAWKATTTCTVALPVGNYTLSITGQQQ